MSSGGAAIMSSGGAEDLSRTEKAIFILFVVAIFLVAMLGIIKYIVNRSQEENQEPSLEGHASRSSEQPNALRAASNSTPTQILFHDSPKIERFFRDLEKEKPTRFKTEDIKVFTKNLSKEMGSGGFGRVFKGKLPEGIEVAVKVLDGIFNENLEKQFMAEVGIIGRIHHKNLIRLYGYCFDTEKQMIALVYEYMENGSLDKRLFEKDFKLEWSKLHEIAIGTAKGIAYLHEDCKEKIIHYDIKPSNILLDGDFVPKVADFGLAKLCSKDEDSGSDLGCRGTPGYAAPELYTPFAFITRKCDVYSFGMLLFEIIGQRRNTNRKIDGYSENTLDWFPKKLWIQFEKGKLEEMVADCGIEEEDREKGKRMAKIALWCVQTSPDARPTMSTVLKMLEGEGEIPPPPIPGSFYAASVAVNPLCKHGDSSSQCSCIVQIIDRRCMLL